MLDRNDGAHNDPALASIRANLHAHSERLLEAVAKSRAAAATAIDVEDGRRDEALADAQRSLEAANVRIRERATHDSEKCDAQLAALLSPLERGSAICDWESPNWARDPADEGPASLVRLGVCTPSSGPLGLSRRVPFLAPVMDGGHVVVRTSTEDREPALGLLQAVLLRILASVPLGRIRYRIFDPQGLGSSFSSFGAFNQDGVANGLPLTSTAQLDAAIEELVQHANTVSATYLKGEYSTLTEFLAKAGRGVAPYQVLVLLDVPAAIREETAARISRLAYEGPSRGVCLLVHEDARAGDSRLDLGPRHVAIERAAGHWHASHLEGVRFAPDPPPPAQLISRVAGRSLARPPVVGFDRIVSATRQGTQTSAEGLTTTIGAAGLEAVSVTLGDQPVHALIGGGSGMGKSNLLRALIYGFAYRYPPRELELYLLDFKQGVEFAEFARTSANPTWLPHARVVSVNSDRAFGTAVLEHIAATTSARYEALNDRNFRKLAGWRRSEPSADLPRIVLVIDEFHVLFQEPDEYTERSTDALNVLARQGRAAGVHVVLASQTVSDVGRGVGGSSKFDGIFGQFALRMALHTTPSESQAILQLGNKAAAELHEPGVAIVNRSLGSPEHNQRAMIARIDDDRALAVRRELWSAHGAARRPPRIFDGRVPADPSHNASLARAGQTRARVGRRLETWVGSPMVLDHSDPARTVDLAARFTGDRNRHLAAVGAGVAEAVSILQWATIGLALQVEPGRSSFTLLDLLRDDDEDAIPSRVVAATAAFVERLGHGCRVVSGGDVAGEIVDLHGALAEPTADRPETFVVGFGLDRAPRMNQEIPGESRWASTTPTDSLRALLAEGALSGLHVIGWWTTLDAFAEQTGRTTANVGMLAFLRVPQKEIRSVIPAAPAWQPSRNRALWFDRDHWTTPTPFVPYGIADEAWLARFPSAEGVAV